jgi:hypothetical protein
MTIKTQTRKTHKQQQTGLNRLILMAISHIATIKDEGMTAQNTLELEHRLSLLPPHISALVSRVNSRSLELKTAFDSVEVERIQGTILNLLTRIDKLVS